MVYIFIGVYQGESHERESLGRVARALDLPALLIGNLPGFKGIPAVDGVLFSKVGNPIASVSLKTFFGDTTKGITAVKGMLLNNRASIRDHFSIQYLSEMWGFTLDKRGRFKPKQSNREPIYRELILRGTFKILGMEKLKTRPIWIALDFSMDPFKSLNVRQGNVGLNPIPFDGTFIEFVDSREEPGSRTRAINIETLAVRAGHDSLVTRYLFLMHQGLHWVDSSGLKEGARKYDGSSCARELQTVL
ncbi:MAG: hypothetical protein IPL83_07730 [Bdellovibrionales bacterium]|nr:hypothetical protein [Bdellovibrionales bacterium]